MGSPFPAKSAKSRMTVALDVPVSLQYLSLAMQQIARLCYIHSKTTGAAMSTTTIRIEDDLKARVAAAAQQMGKSAHAFIVDALAQTVEQVELDAAFQTLADERWANIRTTGKTVAWIEAKTYLAARASGERPRKPTARKLSK